MTDTRYIADDYITIAEIAFQESSVMMSPEVVRKAVSWKADEVLNKVPRLRKDDQVNQLLKRVQELENKNNSQARLMDCLKGKVKELDGKIEALEKENKDLKARVTDLELQNTEKEERITMLEVRNQDLESKIEYIGKVSTSLQSLREVLQETAVPAKKSVPSETVPPVPAKESTPSKHSASTRCITRKSRSNSDTQLIINFEVLSSFVEMTTFKLTEELQSQISEEVREWSLAHGLLMGGKVAPVTLLPTQYPKHLFHQAEALALPFNRLTHLVAYDRKFMNETMKFVRDPFAQSLLKIYNTVFDEGLAQSKVLGIHRSDYMIHQQANSTAAPSLKQVEMNRISCAFGALSSLTSKLHKHVIEQFELEEHYSTNQLPPKNDNIENIPFALSEAHRHYGKPNAAVVFLVQPGEKNSIDQRQLGYKLQENYGIKVLRRTHHDIYERAKLDENNGRALWIDGHEVSVIYFRSGYTPKDYPTEAEWAARLTIERSRAIKCPNVAYQLAGLKKVQQVLADPGVVEKFMPTEAAQLRECFAGLYSLDPPQVQQTISRLLNNVDGHVMKPQREGGGNLFYGNEMKQHLLKAKESNDFNELADWIAMERLYAPAVDSLVLRDGVVTPTQGVQELGMFSCCLADTTSYNGNTVVEYHLNTHSGHLLRTKSADKEDGGVAAGVAVLDSPFLI